MVAVSIQPAATLPLATLVPVFNAGYSGYTIPVNLTEDHFQQHVLQNDIDLAASRVVLIGEEPVGICLLGIRENRGWIGGLGVHLDYRRQGLGRQLMQAVIEAGRSCNLLNIYLEVIVGNEGARQLYLKLGFMDTRRLLILERQPAPIEDSQITIESGTPAELLCLQTDFHQEPVAWQQSQASLRQHVSEIPAWRIHNANDTLAYAIGHTSDSTLHWLDLGCLPGQAAALRTLLMQLHQRYPDATGRIVNIGESEPAVAVLNKLGYQETLSQHEMRLDF